MGSPCWRSRVRAPFAWSHRTSYRRWFKVYGHPGEDVESRAATVQNFAIGDSSIVHDGERVSVFLDISKVDMPPLRQFRYVKVVSDHVLDYEVFSILGIDKLYVRNGPISVALVAYDGSEILSGKDPGSVGLHVDVDWNGEVR